MIKNIKNILVQVSGPAIRHCIHKPTQHRPGALSIVLVIIYMVLLLPVFNLLSCKENTIDSGIDERINVIVSIPPQEEFLEKVGGDRVIVTTMVPAGSNPHTYEPLPSQLREVNGADLYFKIGTGIDFEIEWMDEVLDLNREIRVIDCSEGIKLKFSDPHIWLSPVNAAIMVENIYRGLADFDPENIQNYQSNKELYLSELEQLDKDISMIIEKSGVKIILVSHPAWTYFADEYGLEQLAVEVDGKEPTPGALEKLVKMAVENEIKVIFISPEFDIKSAETIAGEIGASVVMVSPLEKAYIDNMRRVANSFAGLPEPE